MQIGLVVVDATLSPVQQRNLERRWKAKVIDRTGLILEIFGARARTHEGRLQVELAALTYQRSRLVRSWTHLERQRGGFGFLGGPGESQLEIDRRLIGERIAQVEARARGGEAHPRAASRGAQARAVSGGGAGRLHQCRQIDPVQPPDAGRRSAAEDMLFATLDPTMRRLELPSGAPRSSPTRSASSPTCRPISSPPSARRWKRSPRPTSSSMSATRITPTARRSATTCWRCSRDLGLGEAVEDGLIEVLNKIDLLDPAARAALVNQAQRNDEVVALVGGDRGGV